MYSGVSLIALNTSGLWSDATRFSSNIGLEFHSKGKMFLSLSHSTWHGRGQGLQVML